MAIGIIQNKHSMQSETMYYDLPDLRLVAAIADSNSLTRAGAAAGASRAVVGQPSPDPARSRPRRAHFRPPARGLTATAAGESLLRHARQVFAQLEQTHADLAPYASGVVSHG